MGEVASLLPEDTHTMALTATATRSSRQVICKVQGIKNCVDVISKSPNKPNICYRVQQKPTLEEAFGPLIAELRQKRQNMDRVIIFGQTYDDSTYAYMLFCSSLGKEQTHPVGAPDLPKYEEGRERILEAVSKSLSIIVDLDAGMQSGYVTTVVSRSRRGRPRLDVNQAQLEYLLQLGFTCPLIGEALGVSLSTVRRHMAVWPQCDSTVF